MASSSAMAAEERRTFRFKRCLGSGAFGEVYEADLVSPGGLEKRVAVKLLKPEVAHNQEQVSRLRDEAFMLSNLDHPNILTVLDLVDIGPRTGLVMEFVDGLDLRELLRGTAGLPQRTALEICALVAHALDAAWSSPRPGSGAPMRLIHRDVKPQNIRVSRHGSVKLLDFGIARTDDIDREARTETAVVMGSVPYMAPEMFVQGEVGHRLDVFGLGCVLFEAVSGRRFYTGLKRHGVFQLLASEQAFLDHRQRQMGELVHQPALVEVLVSCLEWKPSQRPSAAELAMQLERLSSFAEGPTLRDWCRSHEWMEVVADDGDLTGMTFTEGRTEQITAQQTDDEGRVWFILLGFLSLLGSGVLGALLLLALGPGLFKAPVPPGPATPAIPAPVLVIPVPPVPSETEPPTAPPVPSEMEPPSPPPVAPEPVPAPPSVRPQAPKPPPPPRPSPQPAEKAAEPEPAPSPTSTAVRVYFQNRAGEKFAPDTKLKPGTYRIIADFGDGFNRVGSATVESGQNLKLVCNPVRKSCRLQ